jgi:hypothetical protein
MRMAQFNRFNPDFALGAGEDFGFARIWGVI